VSVLQLRHAETLSRHTCRLYSSYLDADVLLPLSVAVTGEFQVSAVTFRDRRAAVADCTKYREGYK